MEPMENAEVIEVGSDTDEEVRVKLEEAGVISGAKVKKEVGDAEPVAAAMSDTESSMSASGDVAGAQVNALFSHHWVKQPLDEQAEAASSLAEVEGFIHSRVRGGCK